MKQKIAIKIPTLLNVCAPLCSFLTAIAGMDKDSTPYEFKIDYYIGYSPHDHARNVAVQDVFADKSISRVWFIDSDITPTTECMGLVTLDADIATGAYANAQKDYNGDLRPITQLYQKEGDEFAAIDHDDDVVAEVDGAGMGMMLIKREVITDPRMRAGEAIAGSPIPVFRHRYNDDGSLKIGEDLDFCRRAKANGYKIVASTRARCGHAKTINMIDWQKSLWALKSKSA